MPSDKSDPVRGSRQLYWRPGTHRTYKSCSWYIGKQTESVAERDTNRLLGRALNDYLMWTPHIDRGHLWSKVSTRRNLSFRQGSIRIHITGRTDIKYIRTSWSSRTGKRHCGVRWRNIFAVYNIATWRMHRSYCIMPVYDHLTNASFDACIFL